MGQGQGQRTRSSRGQLYALTTSIPKRGGNASVKSLAALLYHTVGTLFLYTSHPFNSASIVESLHLSTSVVEGPIFVSNPVGESAHLFMTCLDLRTSMPSVEIRSNASIIELWMDSRDEVVIQ